MSTPHPERLAGAAVSNHAQELAGGEKAATPRNVGAAAVGGEQDIQISGASICKYAYTSDETRTVGIIDR